MTLRLLRAGGMTQPPAEGYNGTRLRFTKLSAAHYQQTHWGNFNQLSWNLLQMHIIPTRYFIFYSLNLASYVNFNVNKTDD